MHMNHPKITPKDFFLWAGAMLSLYISVFTFVSLLFSYIDYAFPDALDSYVDPYSSGMRASIAALIVLFPLALFLMRLIRKGIEMDATRDEIWIRRWALVLTVFLAAAAVVIDLITLINYFLGGDLSTRFVLKVGVVLLVAGGFFMHFLADIKGYWTANPRYARMVGWGAFAVVIASIIAGFFIMGSPAQVRLYRFDDQKVSDLQNIQYQVVNFWQTKKRLPQTLAEMEDPLGGFTAPRDTQTGESYVYEIVKAPHTFKLCATFNAETQQNSPYYDESGLGRPAYPSMMADAFGSSWKHGVGEQCFERTIDPDKYPPYEKR